MQNTKQNTCNINWKGEMCDLPENLQVIKREPISPTNHEENKPHNIKAKLNSYVKRRIQDYGHLADRPNPSAAQQPQLQQLQQQQQALSSIIKLENHKPKDLQQKEVRQKRPYNKRTDKTKTALAKVAVDGLPLQQPAATRKYKTKGQKAAITTGNPDALTPNSQDDGNQALALNAGAISAGDEDEAGHDADVRQAKEKEKCPDVLAMVLSLKKRALIQDPEVQRFLAEALRAIKS